MAKQPTEKVITKKHMARLERERQQQRYLIIGAIVIIVLVVAILVYGILDQTVIKSQRPVAKVGSETITTSEFQKEVRFQRAQTIQQLQTYMGDPFIMQIYGSYITEMAGQLEQPTTIGQSVLDKMVEDAVIEQEAKKRGITVSVAEIDKAFEEAFGFFENGTPTPTITSTPFSTSTLAPLQQTLVPPTAAATETAVPSESPTATGAPSTPTAEVTATPAVAVTPESTATITPTETPYTRQGYETAVGSFAENLKPVGYTDADLRSLIRRQVLREKVLNAVTEDVATSQEVLWARHILVADEAEAKKVEEELKNGGNFVDLAKQYSTDTSNKDQGGDLGWFPREQMVTEFSEAAFSLEVGEISQPVKTQFGHHIIQVLGHETRPMDAQELQNAKQTAYQAWLDNAKKELNTQTFDSWTSVVPEEPAIPANLQAQINQLKAQQQQQQQQQQLEQQLELPTEAPAQPDVELVTPAP